MENDIMVEKKPKQIVSFFATNRNSENSINKNERFNWKINNQELKQKSKE
jgi:hypothetical protein